MNGELFKKAIEFINENKRRKTWFRVGSVLAAIVVFVTTYALILPAITVSNKTVCGLEEHVHMYDCYDHTVVGQTKKMICCEDIHKHNEACYNEDGEPICGYADYVFHEHNELCYDGDTLICTLKENKKHEHTDACYEIKTELICGLEESTVPTTESDSAENETPENDTESSENVGEESVSDVAPEEETTESEPTENKHTHTSDCYKTEKILVCTQQDEPHTHTQECYDGDKLICGLVEIAEHEHDGACFETVDGVEKNSLICTKPEHTHGEGCYAKGEEAGEDISTTVEGTTKPDTADSSEVDAKSDEASAPDETDETDTAESTDKADKEEETQPKGEYTKEFTYEDKEISMNVKVDSDEEIPDEAELKVSDLSEKSKLFKLFDNFVKDNETSDSDKLIAKNVSLENDGEELDGLLYNMVAEITVKDSVIEPIKKELKKLSTAAPEALIGVMINPLSESENEVSESEGVILTDESSEPTVTLALNDGLLVLSAKATANPNYSVQYYANLQTFASSGDKALPVIDTSGPSLPKNNSTIKTKSIYLNKTNSKTTQNHGHATDIYKVATKTTLTEIYKTDSYKYISAPNPMYVDKLSDNAGYDVTAIWVLKSGKSASSTNPDDWNAYGADAHFTNRAESAANDIIYITDGTVIRLIYNCVTTSFTTPTTFYDYNITNGQRNSSGSYYTAVAGINSKSNYPATSSNGVSSWSTHNNLIAFGNINTGTGFGYYLFDDGRLNAFNTTNDKKDSNSKGCTFGLVRKYDFSTEKLVYNEWILAPNLFNEGSATGKKTYSDSSITFERIGDTYTISSVSVNDNGTNKTINNLQEFFNPSPTTNSSKYPDSSVDGIYTNIFTNNFWPLDNVQEKTDPLFGNFDSKVKYVGYEKVEDAKPDSSYSSTAVETAFPDSDDGNAHNSYFGMQYAIEFTLTEDYNGPLEYIFYGDDDMWVFLDETLVCDIGGVHSSVGEYVNLWDYLEPERGNGTHKHRLTLFYTERGASGSTCYMNFTLPSVTNINIDQKATSLRVEKEVVGESDPTQEFEFDINIYDSNGTQVKDDYAYTKYDADGNELATDLVLHDGSSFTLKNGEYIIIDYLPFGTRYTVTERDPSGYNVSSKINGVVQLGNEATGTIIKDVVNQVLFTNTIDKVDMTLQKLDISGTPLTGAVFSLTDSDGNPVNFIKNSDGYYTVPTESTQLFDSGGLYYLTLARDTDYVIGADTSQLSDPNAFYLAQLQNKTGVNTQQYKVTINSDGSCSFYNIGANKYIDHKNALIDNSTPVGHWIDDSSPTEVQRWFLILNENGSFKLKPKKAVTKASSAVVDLSGNSKVNGTQIILYEDNGSEAQQWKLVPVNAKEATATTSNIEVGQDGVLHLSGLFPGTYTLGEITAPFGYDKLDGDIKINVAKDGTVSVIDSSDHLVSVDDSDSGLVLKIKNVKTVKELTLEKAVVGSDTEEKFEFDISYRVGDGDAIRQTVELKNGESTVIKIPDGAQVTVSETNNRDFTVSFNSTMPLEVNGNICSFTISDNTKIIAVNTAAGIVIPATGGNGTYMYTIAGAAMIFASLALMYKRKKSGKEKFGIL